MPRGDSAVAAGAFYCCRLVSGSGDACERTSESGNAIAVLRTKRTPAASVDAAGVPMLVRGPLGPPDIICANRVANGLTGDSRGSMKSGRLGGNSVAWISGRSKKAA